MNDTITVDILLEFLYNEFAVTFVFCFLGSCIRSISQTKKQDESKSFNVKRIVISTIFSTLLMCTFTEYIDLQFEVYAFASFFCGLWGLQLCKIAMNIKFIDKFLKVIAKSVGNSIIKGASESASEILDEQENSENKDDKK